MGHAPGRWRSIGRRLRVDDRPHPGNEDGAQDDQGKRGGWDEAGRGDGAEGGGEWGAVEERRPVGVRNSAENDDGATRGSRRRRYSCWSRRSLLLETPPEPLFHAVGEATTRGLPAAAGTSAGLSGSGTTTRRP